MRGTLDPALALLPPIVVLLFCLVLGLSLVVAVLHAHYRDVEPVLAAALLPWFFLTPIFLPVDDMPGVDRPRLGGRRAASGATRSRRSSRPCATCSTRRGAVGGAPALRAGGAGAGALGLGVLLFRRLERDLAVIL